MVAALMIGVICLAVVLVIRHDLQETLTRTEQVSNSGRDDDA